ncbi:DUF305 domain-containing protein [Modestobacter sp. I12A-02628]|uniref:DUF305 domain-containing protein n=1 Tax=Goekera deserti TaxID=2497753 RepID=A0A7K3W7Z3_9ACTN|nr:DUF305 domain-containing protein [Goekera deserti]MPQ99919.1 DUF305 domain-containing protein [Goekera deserti]NDI50078.1 DUF305 domain-containing protein [Goekera deserti]NEL52446.1 DUF305 domain-containing protein [Goekera deserti]
MTAPAAGGASRLLRPLLAAVIAVALVLIGGGLAVALGIGQQQTPGTDSVDAGFSRDMSRHHLQGVEMANLAASRSQDPEVLSLAFDISATQTNQAGRMQGWLALWGLPATSAETMTWMGGSHGHGSGSSQMGSVAMDDMAMGPGGLMPGMATEEELAELRSLSGPAFDVRFLQLMTRHHQGGLEMAQYAGSHAIEPAVATLARTIAETQTAEVTTMTDMLAARGGAPLPAP